MKLVIDRDKWLRGEGAEVSYLLRKSDGKMCCLGFYGLACGLEPEELEGTDAPFNLPKESLKKIPDWLLRDSPTDEPRASAHCSTLMSTNDREIKESDPDFDEKEREETIKHAFALHGVVVEFIN